MDDAVEARADSWKRQTLSRRRFLKGVVGTSGALLLAACASPQQGTPSASTAPVPAAAPAKRVDLRMIMPTEVPHWDRVLYTIAAGEPIWENVLEPLVKLGKGGEPVPMLATEWEHSADLTKWRFYLRKGVKFHNGADFTARDVAETVKWSIDIKDQSFVYARVPVKEVVAIDDHTVDLVFKDPQALLLINIRFLLIYPVAIARENRELAKTLVIGTGPYKFVKWERGQSATLAKFEQYWGPKPQIDNMVLTWRGEASVRLAALQAGEVDWIYALSPEEARLAPKVVVAPSPETFWLRFDESVQKDPLFADKRLRLAVEYAIDRQKLVALYEGMASPSLGQFASPGEFGFDADLKSRPYDLERARSLVREAGAVGTTMTLVGSTDRWLKDKQAAEAVAYMIEQTGLKVKQMLLPYTEFMKYLIKTGENRAYQSDLLITSSDALMEVESRYPKMFVEGGVHYTLNDLEPTRLYKEAVAEPDLTKRAQKLAKAWAYVYEQAHYVPLYRFPWLWGIAKNVEWQVDLTGIPYLPNMRFTD